MNLNKDDIQKLDFNKACHDAVAHEYSKTHLDIFNPIEQLRLMNSLAELKEHVSMDSTVLDFGCGSGNLTDHLMRFGYRVISADVSRKFLDLVAKRYEGNPRHSIYLLKGDPSLDLQGLKFGAICMYSVLHHVPDYLMCLESLANLVESGGLLYIDHEASPDFWSGQALYAELQRRSKVRKYFLNYKKLFTLKWYLTKLKTLQDSRYQEEGDIHVWNDDHIEWELIDEALKNIGFVKLRCEDYLVYQNHYEGNMYANYKDKVSDMRLSVYKKQ